MLFDFMKRGQEYAFHITNEEELIAFSEAERDFLYDSLRFSGGGFLKDDPDQARGDIVRWNKARWKNAVGNRHYDGSIYLTLCRLADDDIRIGWDCNLEFFKRNGYVIMEFSDLDLAVVPAFVPDFDSLF